MLDRITVNERSDNRRAADADESFLDGADSDSRSSKLYVITALVTRLRARKRENFLPKVIGVYLQGSGVKRRVIDTLAGMGLFDTYWHVNKTMDSVASQARVSTSA